MNWQKLNKDYALAYAYMVDNFKCLYTIGEDQQRTKRFILKVKHPLKRDLYDFFDGVLIYICIDVDTSTVKDSFNWFTERGDAPYITRGLHCCQSRSKAETEAFTKAFEIFNDRLKTT